MTTPPRTLRWNLVPIDTAVLLEGEDVAGRLRRDLYGDWAETPAGPEQVARAWRVLEVGLRRDRLTLRGAQGDEAWVTTDWTGHGQLGLGGGRTWALTLGAEGIVQVRDPALGLRLEACVERQTMTLWDADAPRELALLLLAWLRRMQASARAPLAPGGPRGRSRRALLED
jgi:hypothetical protein